MCSALCMAVGLPGTIQHCAQGQRKQAHSVPDVQ